jgi:uncharacterized protein YbaR (Trm112 family)
MRTVAMVLSSLLSLNITGCGYRTDRETEKDLAIPVVPEGFDEKRVESLKCPECGSKLRFATKRELASINDRIGSKKKLKTWNGEERVEPVDAVLIRADGKIGYRVDGVIPVLKIEEALVLNEKVGNPDPKKNHK